MTHHPNQQTPEADRCRGVDRSLLEFLKPKAEERYSKLEAYCDLLSKASSGAYQSPGTDGALQLLPGQFVATISELARQWQWQRATVRQFISGLTKLGQLSVEPYSKSFIFSVNLEQRLSLLIESPDDILDFCAMQFIRFIKGRTTAKEVADSYSRYYDLKMKFPDVAKTEKSSWSKDYSKEIRYGNIIKTGHGHQGYQRSCFGRQRRVERLDGEGVEPGHA